MNANESKKFALFWGCMIQLRLPWIEVAARKVLPRLGIEISDLPFSCCPDPIASKGVGHKSWLNLAARNLIIAEEAGVDILSLCSGCFETLKMAREELKDKQTRDEINSLMAGFDKTYKGETNVFHIQQLLYQRIDDPVIKNSIVNPLSFKVAVHTGCHYTRPSGILQTDDPVYSEQLDELCNLLGLETADYPDKNLCCGMGTGLADSQIPKKLIQRKLDGAKSIDAKAIVAHCPSCILSYDAGQRINNSDGESYAQKLPVLHYLELLGIALGMSFDEFAFEEHHVPVTENIFH